MTDGPFLSRWARRKRDAVRRAAEAGAATAPVQAAPTIEAPAAQTADAPAASPASAPGASPADLPAVSAATPVPTHPSSALPSRPLATQAPAEPALPLPDPQTLTPQSDFTPFMRVDVAPAQRNAALKRLFVDPHFNTMDGLDVYIDDYGRPDPIPPAMLAALQHARALLARDEPPPPDRAAGDAASDSGGTATRAAAAAADAHTDVRPDARDGVTPVDTAGAAATQHPVTPLGAGLEHAAATVPLPVVHDRPAAATDVDPTTGG